MSLYNNSSHCLSRLVRTSLQRCRCRAMASAHKYNALPIGEKVSASKLTAWNQEAASIGLKSKLAAIETATPTEPVGDSQKKVGKFIEEVLSRTLSLETNELKSLYHLCSVQLNDHYQTNESILMLANLLKTYYSPRDIYWNPKIFKVPYHVVYNRTKILAELDFVPTYSVSMIDSLHDILYLTPEQVKNVAHYRLGENSLESIFQTLQITEELQADIRKHILNGYGNAAHVPLTELRIICFAKLLASQFKSSFSRLYKTIKRYDRNFNEICLEKHISNVDYLYNQVKVSPNKIFHNGLFIFLDNDNLSKIASNLMPIVGAHTHETIMKMPTILKVKFDTIVDNYQLIKSKCGGHFYTRSVELLAHKPAALRQNFELIEKNKDIHDMNLKYLGMDFLVINLEVILERIQMLKDEDIPLRHVPISFFQVSLGEFKELLTDFTNDPQLRIRHFLEQNFNLDYEHVKDSLRVVANVKPEKYNSANAKRIIEFLVAENVPKERIIELLYLIFFDYRQVRQAYSHTTARFNNRNDSRLYSHLIELLQNSLK